MAFPSLILILLCIQHMLLANLPASKIHHCTNKSNQPYHQFLQNNNDKFNKEREKDPLLASATIPKNEEEGLRGKFEIMRIRRNVQEVNGSKNVQLTRDKENSQIPCSSCSVSSDSVSGFIEDISSILFNQHEENLCFQFTSNISTCESTNFLLSCMYENFLSNISQLNLSREDVSQANFTNLNIVYDNYKLLKSSLSLRLTDAEMQQAYSCFLGDDDGKRLKHDFERLLADGLKNREIFILQFCIAELVNKTSRKCVKTIQTLDKEFNISNIVLGIYDGFPGFQGTEALLNLIAQFECDQQLNAIRVLQAKLERESMLESSEVTRIISTVQNCDVKVSSIEVSKLWESRVVPGIEVNRQLNRGPINKTILELWLVEESKSTPDSDEDFGQEILEMENSNGQKLQGMDGSLEDKRFPNLQIPPELVSSQEDSSTEDMNTPVDNGELSYESQEESGEAIIEITAKDMRAIFCEDCIVTSDAVLGLIEDVAWILFESNEMPFEFCSKSSFYLGPYTCTTWVQVVFCVNEYFLEILNEKLNSCVDLKTVYTTFKGIEEQKELLTSAIIYRLTNSEKGNIDSCIIRNSEVDTLQKQLEQLLDEISYSRERYMEDLCRTEIANKKFSKCVNAIQKLGKGFNISYVVDVIYSIYTAPENRRIVFRFIAQFDCQRQFNAISELYTKLEYGNEVDVALYLNRTCDQKVALLQNFLEVDSILQPRSILIQQNTSQRDLTEHETLGYQSPFLNQKDCGNVTDDGFGVNSKDNIVPESTTEDNLNRLEEERLSHEELNHKVLCTKCHISDDVMLSLLEDVSMIFYNREGMIADLCNASVSDVHNTSCAQWTATLTCVYKTFLHTLHAAEENSFSSLNTVLEMLQSLNDSVHFRLTDLELLSINSCVVLAAKANQFKLEFEKILGHRIQSREIYISELCVSDIREKSIEKCVSTIIKLDPKFNISLVAIGVYTNSTGHEILETVLRFISQFNCDKQIEVLQYVIRSYILTEDGWGRDLEALRILNTANNCLKEYAILQQLQEHVSQILNKYSKTIIHANHATLETSFGRKCSTVMIPHWGDFIWKIYLQNMYNVENIFNFIARLPYYIQSMECIAHLLTKMIDNNRIDSSEFIMVASKFKSYEVKLERELSVMPRYLQRFYGNNFTYIELKRRIPVSIQKLLWDGNACTIFNKAFQGWLLAGSSDLAFDSKSGYIFWGREFIRNKWNIMPARDGRHLFTIYNTWYDAYMFASGHTLDNYRHVFYYRYRTDVPVMSVSLWKIEPIENATCFRILNAAYEGYLFTGSRSLLPRLGLTQPLVFIPKEARTLRNIQSESKWLITC